MRLPPALRHRNYRLWFAGQGLSVLGTWMQRVAMHWLVYRLSDSEFLLGVSGLVSQVPILLLAPLGGWCADRFDRRRLLALTQGLAMLQAVVLAALTYTGHVTVWQVIALGGLLGAINAFDTPLRQSFAVDLVGHRDDLASAIALNSLVNNSGRLIGPSIAGIIVLLYSEGACFAVNAASYLAVLGAIALIRIAPQREGRRRAPARGGIREGIAIARRSLPIRSVLALIAAVSFCVMPYVVLMPAYVDRVLGGGAHTMGFMLSAAGVGAVCATAYLAWRSSTLGLAGLIAGASLTAGAALAVFALSGNFWLSAVCMVAVGGGVILTGASANTVLQSIVDDEMRGRVASFYTMAFIGVSPLGALALGAAAEVAGIQMVFAAAGAGCVVAALVFMRRLPALRAAIAADRPGLPLP